MWTRSNSFASRPNSKKSLGLLSKRSPLDVLVDPVDVVGKSGVNTGITSTSATDAPRDDTGESTILSQDRATAVTRAGILTTLLETGAEHIVGDCIDSAVVSGALGAVYDGYGDVAQVSRETAILACETPIPEQ